MINYWRERLRSCWTSTRWLRLIAFSGVWLEPTFPKKLRNQPNFSFRAPPPAGWVHNCPGQVAPPRQGFIEFWSHCLPRSAGSALIGRVGRVGGAFLSRLLCRSELLRFGSDSGLKVVFVSFDLCLLEVRKKQTSNIFFIQVILISSHFYQHLFSMFVCQRNNDHVSTFV